jgi:phosphotransferase system HPr-like phosphotransfer protein
MEEREWPDTNNLGRQLQDGREAFAIIWHDHDMPDPADNIVARPVLSWGSGSYEAARTVTITTATEDAEIRYTTDGSEPNGSSALYTTPLEISTNTTLRVIGIKTGKDNSQRVTAVYTFPYNGRPAPVRGVRRYQPT